MNCIGAGSPTVVLDAGQDGSGDAMIPLQTALAPTHLTCRYDRAGEGQSDQVTFPRTATDVVADLHGLLVAAQVPGPYLLIGHSAGGVFVQLYARTYPDDVVGVVAINAVPPAGPWLNAALPLMTPSERTDEQTYYQGQEGGEGFDWNASFAQIDAAAPPPAVPFLVLIATNAQCDSPTDVCGRTYGVYERLVREVVGQWPRGTFEERPGSHELFPQPEIARLITQWVMQVSSGSATPVATRMT